MEKYPTISYSEWKTFIESHIKNCRCAINFKYNNVFTYKSNSIYDLVTCANKSFDPVLNKNSRFRKTCKYQYTYFIFNYFDHNNILHKVDKKVILNRYLSEHESEIINEMIEDVYLQSRLLDKRTTIIHNKDHEIFNRTADEIGKYIVDTFKEGETLEYILNCYTKNQKYELKFDYGAKDLLFIEKAEIQFNLYDDQDNHYLSKSKKQKVFDYIVLIIPVIKRNMSYDQVIDFIKLHKKEVDKIIFDLLNLKLKQREKKGLTIPINFLDFDKSKLVLTRQMQLVFTISVKEIPESIETKGAN